MKRRVLKKKYKKLLINILLVILIIIFLNSTYKGFKIIYYGNKSKKDNAQLVKDVVNINKKAKTVVDFKKLKDINIDVVGWIKIPNTHINYPIMQAFDNSYYLKRDFNNEYNINGSIYMDYKNKSDFSDPNTIIYGHNTHSTDMFSDLKEIYDSNSKDVNIYIYTPKEDYIYKAYSMYLTDPNDSKPINSSTSSFTKSDKDFNIDLKKKKIQHTLTLVTCYSNNDTRLILHAYLKEANV